MATPSKLKRNFGQFSTAQTNLSNITSEMHQLKREHGKDTIKKNCNGPLKQMFRLNEGQNDCKSERTVGGKNLFKDTSEMEKIISMQIEQDSNLSKKQSTRQRSTHCYYSHPSISRVIASQPNPFPSLVQTYYQTILQSQLQEGQTKPSFCQGYLTKLGILYYCVQKMLFFYDGRRLTNEPEININEVYIDKIELDDVLFEIKQMQLNLTSQIIRTPFQDKILVFSHPYCLAFYSYNATLVNEGLIQKKISLVDLKIRINLECIRACCISFDGVNGVIFFLDDGCNLKLIFTTNTPWYYVCHKEKVQFQCQKGKMHRKWNWGKRFNNVLGYSHFQNKPKGILQTITHYYSVIKSCTTTIFYPDTYQNYNLLYDHSRGLIFTMTQQINTNQTNHSQPKMLSNSKIITMYQYSLPNSNHKDSLFHKHSAQTRDVTLSEVCKFSEEEFYYELLHGMTQSSLLANFQIESIHAVPRHYYSNSNLLLFLNNGMRVYVQVRQNGPQLIDYYNIHDLKYQSQPDSEKENLKMGQYNKLGSLKVDAAEPTQSLLLRQVNIAHNNMVLMMLMPRESKITQTYLLYKNSEEEEPENLVQINWPKDSSDQTDSYEQNYLHLVEGYQGFEQKALFGNEMQSNEKWLKTADLHWMVKQMFYLPSSFLYCTESSIFTLHILRPIDFLFTILMKSNEIFNARKSHSVSSTAQSLKRYIRFIFSQEEYKLKDVIQMLIQIKLQPTSRYIVSIDFASKFTKYIAYHQRAYSHAHKILDQLPFEKWLLMEDRSILDSFSRETNESEGYFENEEIFKTKLKMMEGSSLPQQFTKNLLTFIEELSLAEECYTEKQLNYFQRKSQKGVKTNNKSINMNAVSFHLKIQSLLVYVSRYLRTFWHVELNKISQKVLVVLEVILQLQNIYKSLFKNTSTCLPVNIFIKKNIRKSIGLSSEDESEDNNNELNERYNVNSLLQKIEQLLLITKQFESKYLPAVSFEAALSFPPDFLESSLFTALINSFENPIQAFQSYKHHIPIYMTQSLEKSIKICEEIKGINDPQQIIQIVNFDNKTQEYLAYYIYQTKAINQILISWKNKNKRFQNRPIFQNYTDKFNFNSTSATSFNQASQLFQEVKNNSQKYNLDMKMRMLEHVKPLLEKEVEQKGQRFSEGLNSNRRMSWQLSEVQKMMKMLRMQRLIKEKYVEQIKAENRVREDHLESDEDVLAMLEELIMNETEILDFIYQLKSEELEIIYLTLFSPKTSTRPILNQMLQKLSHSTSKPAQSPNSNTLLSKVIQIVTPKSLNHITVFNKASFKEKINYIIANTLKKVDCLVFLQEIPVFLKEKGILIDECIECEYKHLNWNGSRRGNMSEWNQKRGLMWIGCELVESGMKAEVVLEYYSEELKEISKLRQEDFLTFKYQFIDYYSIIHYYTEKGSKQMAKFLQLCEKLKRQPQLIANQSEINSSLQIMKQLALKHLQA